jgi:hypothetical protein
MRNARKAAVFSPIVSGALRVQKAFRTKQSLLRVSARALSNLA